MDGKQSVFGTSVNVKELSIKASIPPLQVKMSTGAACLNNRVRKRGTAKFM